MVVHRTLGPGFLEGGYADALLIGFSKRGIPFEKEKSYPVVYTGSKLKRGYNADAVCHSKIILELNAVTQISAREEVQLLYCFKVTGLQLGIWIIIGSVGNREWKRMII
ncbi:MAG: GxxExxY protein [Anaerolineales bacterium]|nr:GxxExxY protein [Anaerolineales bacterium]